MLFFVLWMPLKSRCSLLIFRSHGQRSRPNCWSFKNVVCSISLGLFAGDVVKLGTKMFPIDFLLTLLKAKVKLLICTPSVVCSISSDLLLDC